MARIIRPGGFAGKAKWLDLFSEPTEELEVNGDGTEISIRVPGLIKGGVPNNKGNVVMKFGGEEAAEMIEAIAQIANEPADRKYTPAEMIRRTATWEEMDGVKVLSFRISNDSGTRTVRVPAEDLHRFLEILTDKVDGLFELLAQLNEER